MPKKCKPAPEVRKAARTLSTSESKHAKREAVKKLADHRWTNHE